MKFSIIIPIHNEEKYLKEFLFDLIDKLKSFRDYEIILVENGSTDKTRRLARQICDQRKQVRMLNLPEGNYGLAVKKGFLSAKGDCLVLFDLDYYDVGFMKNAFKKLSQADAVVGTKTGKGSRDQRSFLRRLISFGFTSILKIFFNLKISDTHGIKVLDRKKFIPLIKKCLMTKEVFDTELLIRGQYEGLNLSEIGVKVEEKRQSRTSIIKRSVKTVKDLVLLKASLVKENRQKGKKRSNWGSKLLPVLLLLFSFFLIKPSLSLPFSLIDDTEMIKRSEVLSQQFSQGDFSNTGWVFLEQDTGRTRPFYWISMYLRFISFGKNAFLFHVSDIFITLGIVASLYYLVKRISRSSLVSFFTVLPVILFHRSIENLYRLGPQEPLMLLLILLSLVSLLNIKKKKFFKPLSWMFIILAILTKETAIFTIPLLILLSIYKKNKDYWQLTGAACLAAVLIISPRFLRIGVADYSSNYQISLQTIIETFRGYKAQLDSTWMTGLFKVSLVSFVIGIILKQDIRLSLVGLLWFTSSFALLLPWKLVLGRYLLPVLPGLSLFIVSETKRQIGLIKKPWLFIFLSFISLYYWSNFLFTNITQSANIASGYVVREKANAKAVSLMSKYADTDSIVYINTVPDLNTGEWVIQAENQLAIFHDRGDVKINYLPEKIPSNSLIAEWSFFAQKTDLELVRGIELIEEVCLSTKQTNTLLKPAIKSILTKADLSYLHHECWKIYRSN